MTTARSSAQRRRSGAPVPAVVRKPVQILETPDYDAVVASVGVGNPLKDVTDTDKALAAANARWKAAKESLAELHQVKE